MPDDRSYTEKELLSRIAEGDERAFAALCRDLLPALESLVTRVLQQDEPVMDVIQEALIRIWLHRDKLAGLENPRAWIKRVVLNETFTWLNKKTARTKGFIGYREDAAAAFTAPVDKASFQEMQSLIQQAIALLPPQRRQIFEMSRGQGLTSGEIAAQLNLSNGYVKNAISAALAFMREYLVKAGWILFVLLLPG